MGLVTGAVTLAGITVAAEVLHTHRSVVGSTAIPWWGVAVAYFLSGVFVAHVTFRNQAYTLTLGEVALVLGLVAASPTALIAGGLAGTALALTVVRRQQPLKVVFNLATFLVEAGVAVLVMQALLGGHRVSSGTGWMAAVGGTVAASALGQVMVAVIVLTSAGGLSLTPMLRTFAFMMIAAVLNTVLGLCALQVAARDPALAALLLIPCAVLAAAYRSYLSERHKHGTVRQLFEASAALHRSHGVDGSITTLLARAQEMFNAEVAELTLHSRNHNGPGRRYTLGPHDGPVLTVVEPSTPDDHPASGRATLLQRPEADCSLQERGLRDGMTVPISGGSGLSGRLTVANRRDMVSSFDRGDLALLEAFAGPASVALENGRLEAELEAQAFHDSLTGLANRVLLAQRLQALISHDRRDGFAVLLLDVDDFKAVNDTLGHAAGDQLLVAIAGRLGDCVSATDTVARLGGDEFALLVDVTAGAGRATAIADRVLESLGRPFRIANCEVSVHVSIGMVVDGATATSVDDLLSSADIAMYRAKAQGKNCRVLFEPLMHAEVMARHQLRLDLEHALTEDQLHVVYQPIVSLESGEVTGAEALVRWNHPTRGPIGPDEFIPLAEETGLIVPLGRFVLNEACAQMMAWRPFLPGLRINVNVSPRQLQDPDVVAEVESVFAAHGVLAGDITLEVTERVMVEGKSALATLSRTAFTRRAGRRRRLRHRVLVTQLSARPPHRRPEDRQAVRRPAGTHRRRPRAGRQRGGPGAQPPARHRGRRHREARAG